VPEVRKERTGWRDEALGRRHRKWGYDCPAVDVDFLMIEYDQGKPVALVEYKNEHADPQDPKRPSYRAMSDLGTRGNIPVFAVRYTDDLSSFTVTWLNNIRRRDRFETNEEGYVRFLYNLRGRQVPQDKLDWIIANKPVVEKEPARASEGSLLSSSAVPNVMNEGFLDMDFRERS
jgi:hypothetical protein